MDPNVYTSSLPRKYISVAEKSEIEHDCEMHYNSEISINIVSFCYMKILNCSINLVIHACALLLPIRMRRILVYDLYLVKRRKEIQIKSSISIFF